MQRNGRNGNKRAESRAASVNPVALTLAVWLSLVVGVAGLSKLSNEASTGYLLGGAKHHSSALDVGYPFAG